MKKALIDTARRQLCQVSTNIFPVAPGLAWRDCADDVTPETHDFDGTTFVRKPAPAPPDQRRVADETERAAARLDGALMALVDSTPAQLQSFAQNNFPSLTVVERNRMALLLNILAVAVRPHVR